MNLRVLVLAAMITAFAPLSMDLYLPGLPDLRTDLAASDAAAHLTVTGCIVGLALGQFATGLVPERYGRKPPLVVGISLWICATIACALAPTIWVITALRVAQGVGAGLSIALARSVIADLDPEHLAEHLSRMMLVLSVVPILAPAIGGLALSLTSWRGLFASLAVTGIVLLLVVRRFLPESRPPREDEADLGAAGGLRHILALGRKPAFLLPAVVSGAGFGVLFSYISDSPFVFRDHYELGPTAYGLMFGINASSLIAGFQLGPLLKRRWGTRRVLLIATTIGAIGGTAMVVSAAAAPAAVAPIAVSLMVMLLAAGIVIPLATAAAIDAHPEHVGSASGLSGALQFLIGGTLATLPVALDLGDGAIPLGAACTACLIGAWFLVLLFMAEPRPVLLARSVPPAMPAGSSFPALGARLPESVPRRSEGANCGAPPAEAASPGSC